MVNMHYCFFFADGAVLNILHSENLDDDILWIVFYFPSHNDEPRISSPVAIFCVKNSITDRCFIRKSVEALITNEHYCLRASKI
jgi:hypothetical protein